MHHGRSPDDVKVLWAAFLDFREEGWDVCNSKHLENVIDRLAPALQAAGVMQREYGEGTLRDRLSAAGAVTRR